MTALSSEYMGPQMFPGGWKPISVEEAEVLHQLGIEWYGWHFNVNHFEVYWGEEEDGTPWRSTIGPFDEKEEYEENGYELICFVKGSG